MLKNELFSLITMFWTRRDLILMLSRREIDLRYKGAGLGIVWAIIALLVQLLIFTFIFGFIFKTRWPVEGNTGIAGYALILFSGLVCFSVFSETISRVGLSIISAPYLVKKVIFPVELLPIASMNAALFHASIGLVLIIFALVFNLQAPPLTILLLPFVLLPLFLFTLGFAWFFSALGVFLKDTQFLSTLISQLLFYATPIIYPLDMVPENFHWIILLNPLTHCVDMFRQVVLFGLVPNILNWFFITLVCFVVAMVGFYLFSRMKHEFADVI